MRFTHGFDYFCKVAALIGSIAALSGLGGLFSSTGLSAAKASAWSGIPEWVFAGIGIAVALVVFAGVFWLFFSALVLSGLPTWLYARISLCTPLSLTEAKEVACLFDGSFDGRWHPLKDLLLIPKDRRREILFRLAKERLMRVLLGKNQ